MSQFDLTAYAPTEKVWWTAPIRPPKGVKGAGSPRLLVCHAGRTNRPYANALAALTSKSSGARRAARSGSMTADVLDENLENDRTLFPIHVITAWEDVYDSAGNPVTFSGQACVAYLKAMPAWMVQELSNYCSIPSNFTPDDAPDASDTEETAGE